MKTFPHHSAAFSPQPSHEYSYCSNSNKDFLKMRGNREKFAVCDNFSSRTLGCNETGVLYLHHTVTITRQPGAQTDRMLHNLPRDQQIPGSTETPAQESGRRPSVKPHRQITKNITNITNPEPEIWGFGYSM